MKEVLRILHEIEYLKGNAKHPVVVKYIKENELFAKVVKYTLDTSKTFKVKKIEKSDITTGSEDLFDFLDYLDGKRGTTKEDKQELSFIASADDATFEVVTRILKKKLGCGITEKSLNKLMPGFVPYFPYMRCKSLSHIKNIVFPCFSQLKADGEYHEREGNTFRTRNGKNLDFSLVDTGIPTQGTLMGECLMLSPDGEGFMDRRDGNAIINKAQHSGLSKEEASRVRFVYWDVNFGDTLRPYKDRWDDLMHLAVNPIECKVVSNIEEAWDHYKEVRALGLEGTILKNFDGLWADGNSSDQIKLKAEKECELEVFDIVPGEGKYVGMVGSLRCRSSCGNLVTDVGMGLTDEDRARTDWVGQIITVKFNEISRSKAKDTWAMSHARLIAPREDKAEADDLRYIKNVKEVKNR